MIASTDSSPSSTHTFPMSCTAFEFVRGTGNRLRGEGVCKPGLLEQGKAGRIHGSNLRTGEACFEEPWRRDVPVENSARSSNSRPAAIGRDIADWLLLTREASSSASSFPEGSEPRTGAIGDPPTTRTAISRDHRALSKRRITRRGDLVVTAAAFLD